jgi:hypothetical protein
MLSLLFFLFFGLEHEAQILKLGQHTLAGTSPWLHTVVGVSNWTLMYLVPLNRIENNRFAHQSRVRAIHRCGEMVQAVEQHHKPFVETFFVWRHVQFTLTVSVFENWNLRVTSICVQIVLVKLVAKSVGKNNDQVNYLAESGGYFLPAHFNPLGSAQSEATNSGDFVDSSNRENFADKSGLLEFLDHFLNSSVADLSSFSLVLLHIEFLFIFYEISPKRLLFFFDLVMVLL